MDNLNNVKIKELEKTIQDLLKRAKDARTAGQVQNCIEYLNDVIKLREQRYKITAELNGIDIERIRDEQTRTGDPSD